MKGGVRFWHIRAIGNFGSVVTPGLPEHMPGRDAKQIFAIGAKERGELVRYDTGNGSLTFPIQTTLCGAAAAMEANVCSSLTPPMDVNWPFISPDGTKVACGRYRRWKEVPDLQFQNPEME
jgi:hypothetical protein